MSPVKVTVIIPVFNVEVFLRKCLHSVTNQTLKELEIICINDSSTDGSLAILEDFRKKDERVEVITIDKSGQGVARNLGIKKAKGEFIGFVDSDDLITPCMFETLYDSAVRNDSKISYCMTECFNIATSKTVNFPYFDNERTRLCGKQEEITYSREEMVRLFPYITVVAWNKLYKKELLQDEEILFAEGLIQEDIPFTFHALLKADKVTIINKPLYKHSLDRINSTMNTITEKNHRHIFEILSITENSILPFLENPDIKAGYDLFKVKELTDSLNRVYRSNTIKEPSKHEFFHDVKGEFKNIHSHLNLDFFYFIQFFLIKAGMRKFFHGKVMLDLAKERIYKK